MKRATISDLVPGGIRSTDHIHKVTNDHTCSRCRRLVGDGELPLMLWIGVGDDMLLYCQQCCEGTNGERQRDDDRPL